jgi:Protein of unknown function (DUF1761)
MHHLHFNHWAILVSALVQWFLGALWYSPVLFAKPWMTMVGIQKDAANKKTMVPGMIMSFIGSLITSFILVHILLWSGASTVGRGAFIGFIAWAGFIAAPLAASYIYENRPFKLFAINTGYWLVCLIASGILLAVWH